MTIDKEVVVEFLRLKEIIEEECSCICREMYKLDPTSIPRYLAENGVLILFDLDGFIMEAEETWRYGGYENYRQDFPISWLTSEDWKLDVISKKAEKDAKQLAEKLEAEQERNAKEKREYERLAKKFNAELPVQENELSVQENEK